jgi:ankyrin repeat protein
LKNRSLKIVLSVFPGIAIIIFVFVVAKINLDTSLIKAIEKGDFQKVQEIANIDNVNDKGRGGTTPLIKSIRIERYDISEYLIKSGADVNMIELSSGVSPLMLSVLKENFNLVKLLAKSGAKLNYRDLYDNMTAMNYALEKKDTSENSKLIYDYLKDNGAKTISELPVVSEFELFILRKKQYFIPLFSKLPVVLVVAIIISLIIVKLDKKGTLQEMIFKNKNKHE